MISKRDIEKRIFEEIYKPDFRYDFEHQDKPDFWLKTESGYRFGVEITELYQNESSARLDKIDNYGSELLNEKKFRHKDDKDQIIIDQIKILDKNENFLSEEEAIVQRAPSLELYINFLIDRINEKTDKSKKYNTDLKYFNLIIKDKIHTLSSIKQDRITDYLFTNDLIKALLNCSFEEVFLITKIDNKTISFPLKRILFIYHNYLFQEIINRLHKPKESLEESYYYSFLIEFLENQGFNKLKISKRDERFEVIYANTGYTVKDNSVALILYEFSGVLLFEEPKKAKTYITKDIEQIIEEEKSKFGFSSGLETIIEEK